MQPFIIVSSAETNNPKNNMPSYNIFHCDHPSYTQRVGVCIYYKEHLPIARCDDLSILSKCTVTEINTGTKSAFLTCN